MSCAARFGVPFGWRREPYVKWERVVPVEIEPNKEAIKVADALARLPPNIQRKLIAMVGDKLITGDAWDHFAALLAQHLDVRDVEALAELTAKSPGSLRRRKPKNKTDISQMIE